MREATHPHSQILTKSNCHSKSGKSLKSITMLAIVFPAEFRATRCNSKRGIYILKTISPAKYLTFCHYMPQQAKFLEEPRGFGISCRPCRQTVALERSPRLSLSARTTTPLSAATRLTKGFESRKYSDRKQLRIACETTHG